MIHSFDFKGFYFSIKFLLILTILFLGAKFLPLYLYEETLGDNKNIAVNNNIVFAGSSPKDEVDFPSSLIKIKEAGDFVFNSGKFILANLVTKDIILFVDGQEVGRYPILAVGRPETIRETPSGFFKVIFKDSDHLAVESGIYMPYSVNFFGKYFIHGWPYYYDGTPVSSSFSGGCIRLATNDAQKVFDFSKKNTPILVWDDKLSGSIEAIKKLWIKKNDPPKISAEAFLVADLKSGQIFLEKETNAKLPIASITKILTAIVATETIGLNKNIVVGGPKIDKNAHDIKIGERFKLDDLLHPLLMESDNEIANDIANFQNRKIFIEMMNSRANSIGMSNTFFDDPSGVSSLNQSTAMDLFFLARYLFNKEEYLLGISRQKQAKIVSNSGIEYVIKNKNVFSDNENYIGGKTGTASFVGETFLAIFSKQTKDLPAQEMPVAIILIGSESRIDDTNKILDWLSKET